MKQFIQNAIDIMMLIMLILGACAVINSFSLNTKLSTQVKMLGDKLLLIGNDDSFQELLDSFITLELQRQIENNKIYSAMQKKDISKADYVYRASKEYDIDPILLTHLINSESGFDENVTHKHSEVKGLGGIHTRYWKIPNTTIEEQIYATAYVFSHYYHKHGKDTIKALKAYKGWSSLGEKRANYVYSKYQEYIKENN